LISSLKLAARALNLQKAGERVAHALTQLRCCWYEDDGDEVGGPYEDEEKAIEAANNGKGW